MTPDDTAPTVLPASVLTPGTVVHGRFTVGPLAGRGGMGHVYRARDTTSGRTVALKLLHTVGSAESVLRFSREAALLEGLHHPGIVAYVAHGTTERGQSYLAMEWVEGEDLAHRLARQPLTLPQTLALLHRAAEALAYAHQRGIVHRDIKPSNLLLRGGRPEDVVVLDFGLARHAVLTQEAVTGSHTVVGTPGYMAPEQASSQSEIPPAADIFSLGCVLYECLTGKPPFAAPHFAAALAKILFTTPEPLQSLRPGLPAGLQVLVDRMLAKDCQRRLPDAHRLLETLSALEAAPELLLPHGDEVASSISLEEAEQKLVSVLLVSLPMLAPDEDTATQEQGTAVRDALRTTLWPYGAQVELLADGSLVATLIPERGMATDQAALAARCALTFKERWSEATVVLVTGLGRVQGRLPVGEAMDRLGHLLHQMKGLSDPSLVMDEVTAGLLGPAFQLSRLDSNAYLLQGERLSTDASRPLMGKPTPCVGREQDLALLDFTLSSCIEDEQARALLVLAPAGVGKSRLRHEFLRRLERRPSPVQVLLGQGDALGAGTTLGLLGQALRRLCGIEEGQHLEMRRTRIHQRVAACLPEQQAGDVSEFLGELCAVPFPEEDSPRLRAARSDPRLMSLRMGRALVDFFKAECARQPVLLVLEDLHWSDALTVKLVDELLRELAERPFLVLAFARPEVKELFPGLWSRHVQDVTLKGLSRKASTNLVREVLGAGVPEALLHKAVAQSDGNALLLEELIRALAEGQGVTVPGSVLALLQARLMRMEPRLRHVLLAASVFGHAFWSTGVRELLGPQETALDAHLRQLVEEEIITQQPTSRFGAVDEYHFRHALLRDAAYSLMPGSQLSLAHRLAAHWLELQGETDALVLAAHHQLGQQPGRAAHFHVQAAEQLFERHDLEGALRCVEAALRGGVSGPLRSRLCALQAVVLVWMDQTPRALEIGGPVLEDIQPGSALWCRLVGGLATSYLFKGDAAQVARVSQLLLTTQPEPDAVAAYVESCVLLGSTALWSGMRERMEVSLQRVLQVGNDVGAQDAVVRGWTRDFHNHYLYYFEAAPWRALVEANASKQAFGDVGMEVEVRVMQAQAALTLAALGEPAQALPEAREAMASLEHTESQLQAAYVRTRLTLILTRSSDPEHWSEAQGIATERLQGATRNPLRQGLANLVLGRVLLARREVREAEGPARLACELLSSLRTYLVPARTLLSTTLLAQGRHEEARREAEEGVRALEAMRGQGAYAVGMHLALAEACLAQEDLAAGEAALRKALGCVKARADDIPDPAVRERFLRQVPENARTRQLARECWGDDSPDLE